ncbi:MAG: sulfite exporter TauE/SafE family protein [Candidatus Margulisiibacteriota bacterium]|jgi:thiol:disulfide interchange protein DsbD
MSYQKLLFLFFQGLLLGWGPCLLSCLPIVVPLVGSSSKKWQDGLWNTLLFSLGKTLVYVLLAGLFGTVGFLILEFYQIFIIGILLKMILAVFLLIAGILIIFGRGAKNVFCQKWQSKLDNRTTYVWLGIIVGLSPCLPLMGVLTEVAVMSDKIYYGFLYGLAFGLGSLLSPLLVIGALTPLISAKYFDTDRWARILQYISGGTLIMFGAYLVHGVLR